MAGDRTKKGPTPKRSVQRAARKRGLPAMPPPLVNNPVHGEKLAVAGRRTERQVVKPARK